MEALTAVQVGLLTIYDMCKAVDRGDGDRRRPRAREARRQVGRLGRGRLARRAQRLSGSPRSGTSARPARHWKGGALAAEPGAARDGRSRAHATCRRTAQGAKNSSACFVAEFAQPLGDLARLVGLAALGERLGPGHHQARVEQIVGRALERAPSLGRGARRWSLRRSRRGGRRGCSRARRRCAARANRRWPAARR